jgi:hypothetical protein
MGGGLTPEFHKRKKYLDIGKICPMVAGIPNGVRPCSPSPSKFPCLPVKRVKDNDETYVPNSKGLEMFVASTIAVPKFEEGLIWLPLL